MGLGGGGRGGAGWGEAGPAYTHRRHSWVQAASAPLKILKKARHETHMGVSPFFFLIFKKGTGYTS